MPRIIKLIFREWISWVSILVSFLCFYLGDMQHITPGEMPKGFFSFLSNESYNTLISCKGYFLLCLIILSIILYVIYFCAQENEQKKWLIKFLQHLTNQHLRGGTYNTRITIFKKQKGLTILWLHLWRCITKKRHHWSMVPNPIKDYLCIYVRYCSIEKKKSYTYFRINHECNGVGSSLVAQCFHTGKVLNRYTDTIKGITLPNKLNDQSSKEEEKVKEKKVTKYMRETLISDYDTLLSINSPSNSLLALPIIHDTKGWGVLVFDQISEPGEKVINFSNIIKDDFLNSYQKIIQFTTQLIK